MTKTLYLQGMAYSGKTSVGKDLAQKLGVEFKDSRDLFISKHGIKDLQYLNKYGKESFLKAEEETFLEKQGESVIALSGSALYSKKVMSFVKENGILVWLKPTINILECRKVIEEETTGVVRPIVYPEGIKTFGELAISRGKIYESHNPNIIIEILDENKTIEDISNEIISHYKAK